MTIEEIDMANKEVARQGILLSLPASYWGQFITKNGKDVDAEALVAAGYDGDGQVDWIRTEMRERGWLGGEGAQSADAVEEALLRINVARAIERDEVMKPRQKGEEGPVEAAAEKAKSKGKTKDETTE